MSLSLSLTKGQLALSSFVPCNPQAQQGHALACDSFVAQIKRFTTRMVHPKIEMLSLVLKFERCI